MTGLASLRIQNYRCFLDHTVDFGATTIVVGKNNAGKSTLIEALRLASTALRRFNIITSTAAPEWLDDRAVGRGQRLDLNKFGLWAATLFHRYGEPPAEIEASFKDGSRLEIFIGPEGEGHSIFYRADGRAVRLARDVGSHPLPKITILPQIFPLEREEKILVRDYVLNNIDSHLASRHFRNQLNALQKENFDLFQKMVEDSWHGVRVDSFEGRGGAQGGLLQLMIRDGNFVAEAGWMGHGLQMWLQTLWFIARTRGNGTIVLDEPDVYMHPDLQRRLIRLLRSQGAELVVATHSTEILAEVDASNVLVLDRDRSRSTYATDLPAVQRIVEGMGSAQNLQIARLWRAKSLILVEGDDMKVLKRVHDLISPSSALPLDSIPNWSIGGWTGWSNAIGSVVALKNSVDQRIRCYCIFDADYHLEEEKVSRRKKSNEMEIDLHIHSVKEIENFLLVPGLIRRVIAKVVAPPKCVPSEARIAEQISLIAEDLVHAAQDCYVSEFLNSDRAAGAASASKQARQLIKAKRANSRGVEGLVSGKEVISRLSAWSKQDFGVSFGVATLLRQMQRNDVDEELATLVRAISENKNLD